MFYPWLARRDQEQYGSWEDYREGRQELRDDPSGPGTRATHGELGISCRAVDLIAATNQLYADWRLRGRGNALNDFESVAGGSADAALTRRMATRFATWGARTR